MATGERIPFDTAGEIHDVAPRFAEGAIPQSDALTQSEICSQTQVWVKPISPDTEMRECLRGCIRSRTDMTRMSMVPSGWHLR